MESKRQSFYIYFLMLLSIMVIFLTPFGYHIDLGPGPSSIIAMLWEFPSYPETHPPFFVLRYFIEFYIFRFVILFAIIRFLQGKFSRKWLIILAIIGELIPLIISIPASLILNSQGENLSPIVISIPILLLYIILTTQIFLKRKKKLKNFIEP